MKQMILEGMPLPEGWAVSQSWPQFQVHRSGKISGRRSAELKQSAVKGKDGCYKAVSCGGKQGTVEVHRVVNDAFEGPLKAGYHVHHINGDKHDNRAENLIQIPGPENTGIGPGEMHMGAKLTEGDVLKAHYLSGWMRGSEIGRMLGVGGAAISKVLLGKTWKHMEKRACVIVSKRRSLYNPYQSIR